MNLFDSILQPEGSVTVGVATAIGVVAVYNGTVGPISMVHETPAHDSNLTASVRKAGWIASALVGGLYLITRDANIVILGGAAVVAEEVTYRHALMASAESGMIEVNPADYQQAPTSASVSQMTNYSDGY